MVSQQKTGKRNTLRTSLASTAVTLFCTTYTRKESWSVLPDSTGVSRSGCLLLLLAAVHQSKGVLTMVLRGQNTVISQCSAVVIAYKRLTPTILLINIIEFYAPPGTLAACLSEVSATCRSMKNESHPAYLHVLVVASSCVEHHKILIWPDGGLD